MSFLFSLVFGCLVLIGAAAIMWRFFSRRFCAPCPAWLGWLVEVDNPLLRNNSARRIIEHAALGPGMTVLDFGCGPGRLTIPAAKRIVPDGEVTALDLQPAMLKRVRDKAQTEHLTNIRFIEGKAGEGKLERDNYDRVLLVTVLGEIPDRQGALKEMFDSLRPGGVLSITEMIADPHFQRRTTVRRMAVAAGFVESAFFGNPLSYTLNFRKPATPS